MNCWSRRVWLLGLLSFSAAQGQTSVLPAAPEPAHGEPGSRQRLHHCAAEWVRMKKSGEAANRIWRDFWEVCGKA